MLFRSYEPAKGDLPQRGQLLGVLNLDTKTPKDPASPRLIDPTHRTVSAVLGEKLGDLAGMAAQLVY